MTGIVTCESSERMECAIARTLGEAFEPVRGFGASDCRCAGHLFFAPKPMTAAVMSILAKLGLTPRLMADLPGDGKRLGQ